MPQLATSTRTDSAGWSRRAFGGASLAALLANAVRHRPANAEARKRVKSVVLIFNCGAPSHIDLWDPKPNAPDNIRGIYPPIDTATPGIQVTELLPELARRTDKLAILRSLHHQHGGHNSGMYWSITGHRYPMDSTLINPSRSDMPSLGTLVNWLVQRDGYSRALPPYVITPAPHCDSTVYLTPGQFGACFGPRYDPFVLNADPNSASFAVPNLTRSPEIDDSRIAARRELLAGFLAHGHGVETVGQDLEVNQAKALELMTSQEVAQAFDLTQEPAEVRDRYGRHTWGQSHLLARRLVEAGAPFITTVNGQSIVWDTHKDNFNSLKNRLVPPMERAFVALLDDLSDRGLLDSTLVVWMGDFGRTPIINADAGRDHWPQCYTMVLAGGGIRGGQVIGASDKTGAYPANRPLTPADVHATILTALGYDPRALYHLPDGRPVPLSAGEVIQELL